MFGEAAVTTPPEVHEEPGAYQFKRTLGIGESTAGGDYLVPLDKDSDFVLTHITGEWADDFTFNFLLPSGRPYASGEMAPENAVGTGQFPVPVYPGQFYPAGSQLRLRYTNLSAGPNDVEILFHGIKRFKS